MNKAFMALLFAVRLMAQKPFPIDGEVGLRITPKITGGAKTASGAQTSWKESGHFRRVVHDSLHYPLFAYEIDVVSIGGGTYQVTAKPASTEFIQSIQNGTVPKLSAAPDVPTLNSPSTMNCVVGGSVTLELLDNPTTGQKISDVITLVGPDTDEKPAVIRSVKFENFNGVSAEEITQRLKERGVRVGVEQDYHPKQVQAACRVLKELLEEMGHRVVEVSSAVRQIPPRSVEVTFRAAEN